jgi:branched-chain amino acid transport system permease protein
LHFGLKTCIIGLCWWVLPIFANHFRGPPLKNAKAWSLAVAAALGARIGGLAIRRQGIYFSMVTLALALLACFLAIQTPFTGSEDGIQNVPRGHLFGPIDLANDAAMYCVVLVIFVSAVWLLHRAVQSPFSEVLQAKRLRLN